MVHVATPFFLETITDLINKGRSAFAGKDIINIYASNMRDVMATMVFQPLSSLNKQSTPTISLIAVYMGDTIISFIVDTKDGETLYNLAAEKSLDFTRRALNPNCEATR